MKSAKGAHSAREAKGANIANIAPKKLAHLLQRQRILQDLQSS